jgi:predicted HTH transcriptional regulator
MRVEELEGLLRPLVALPSETEWVEFKENNAEPRDIGEYLSAIADAAALNRQSVGFVIWGIKDHIHKIVGTLFRPKPTKVGNQELEN